MNCMCNMKVVVSKIVIDNVLKSYMKWMKSKAVALMMILACSFASGAMLIHKYTLPIVINV